MQYVNVHARVRPFLANEVETSATVQVGLTTVTALDPKTGFEHPKEDFNFDSVFWSIPRDQIESSTPVATQQDVYKQVGLPAVEAACSGRNSVVVAIGPALAGKSYTLFGDNTDSGIIPRFCSDLFHKLGSAGHIISVHLKCFAINNDTVVDLLRAEGDTTQQHTTTARLVTNAEQTNRLITQGLTSVQPYTKPHVVVTFTVQQEPRLGIIGGTEITSQLTSYITFVDTAGQDINSQVVNKGLVSLRQIVQSLAKGNTAPPPEPSLLTRLLTETGCFGGNCSASFLACLSPAQRNYDDIVDCMRMCQTLRTLNTRPKPNFAISDQIIQYVQDELLQLNVKSAGDASLSAEVAECERIWEVVQQRKAGTADSSSATPAQQPHKATVQLDTSTSSLSPAPQHSRLTENDMMAPTATGGIGAILEPHTPPREAPPTTAISTLSVTNSPIQPTARSLETTSLPTSTVSPGRSVNITDPTGETHTFVTSLYDSFNNVQADAHRPTQHQRRVSDTEVVPASSLRETSHQPYTSQKQQQQEHQQQQSEHMRAVTDTVIFHLTQLHIDIEEIRRRQASLEYEACKRELEGHTRQQKLEIEQERLKRQSRLSTSGEHLRAIMAELDILKRYLRNLNEFRAELEISKGQVDPRRVQAIIYEIDVSPDRSMELLRELEDIKKKQVAKLLSLQGDLKEYENELHAAMDKQTAARMLKIQPPLPVDEPQGLLDAATKKRLREIAEGNAPNNNTNDSVLILTEGGSPTRSEQSEAPTVTSIVPVEEASSSPDKTEVSASKVFDSEFNSMLSNPFNQQTDIAKPGSLYWTAYTPQETGYRSSSQLSDSSVFSRERDRMSWRQMRDWEKTQLKRDANVFEMLKRKARLDELYALEKIAIEDNMQRQNAKVREVDRSLRRQKKREEVQHKLSLVENNLLKSQSKMPNGLAPRQLQLSDTEGKIPIPMSPNDAYINTLVSQRLAWDNIQITSNTSLNASAISGASTSYADFSNQSNSISAATTGTTQTHPSLQSSGGVNELPIPPMPSGLMALDMKWQSAEHKLRDNSLMNEVLRLSRTTSPIFRRDLFGLVGDGGPLYSYRFRSPLLRSSSPAFGRSTTPVLSRSHSLTPPPRSTSSYAFFQPPTYTYSQQGAPSCLPPAPGSVIPPSRSTQGMMGYGSYGNISGYESPIRSRPPPSMSEGDIHHCTTATNTTHTVSRRSGGLPPSPSRLPNTSSPSRQPGTLPPSPLRPQHTSQTERSENIHHRNGPQQHQYQSHQHQYQSHQGAGFADPFGIPHSNSIIHQQQQPVTSHSTSTVTTIPLSSSTTSTSTTTSRLTASLAADSKPIHGLVNSSSVPTTISAPASPRSVTVVHADPRSSPRSPRSPRSPASVGHPGTPASGSPLGLLGDGLPGPTTPLSQMPPGDMRLPSPTTTTMSAPTSLFAGIGGPMGPSGIPPARLPPRPTLGSSTLLPSTPPILGGPHTLYQQSPDGRDTITTTSMPTPMTTTTASPLGASPASLSQFQQLEVRAPTPRLPGSTLRVTITNNTLSSSNLAGNSGDRIKRWTNAEKLL